MISIADILGRLTVVLIPYIDRIGLRVRSTCPAIFKLNTIGMYLWVTCLALKVYTYIVARYPIDGERIAPIDRVELSSLYSDRELFFTTTSKGLGYGIVDLKFRYLGDFEVTYRRVTTCFISRG